MLLLRRSRLFEPTRIRWSRLLRRNTDHPAHTETVLHHAEARRPKGFSQRHADFPAVRQGIESPVGFGLIRNGDGEREALELGLAGRATVRSHQRGCADAKTAMHDLILETGRNHAGWRRFGAFLETY